jgi:hypothetical protein
MSQLDDSLARIFIKKEIAQSARIFCRARTIKRLISILPTRVALSARFGSQLAEGCRGDADMETLLIIASIGWVIVGINLLFTYDKESKPDLRRTH